MMTTKIHCDQCDKPVSTYGPLVLQLAAFPLSGGNRIPDNQRTIDLCSWTCLEAYAKEQKGNL